MQLLESRIRVSRTQEIHVWAVPLKPLIVRSDTPHVRVGLSSEINTKECCLPLGLGPTRYHADMYMISAASRVTA